jgi:nitrogen fixation-related uncharacterized protein
MSDNQAVISQMNSNLFLILIAIVIIYFIIYYLWNKKDGSYDNNKKTITQLRKMNEKRQ